MVVLYDIGCMDVDADADVDAEADADAIGQILRMRMRMWMQKVTESASLIKMAGPVRKLDIKLRNFFSGVLIHRDSRY